MKREAGAAAATGALVQVVNSILNYFERASIATQEAAGSDAYLALIAQMSKALENCR